MSHRFSKFSVIIRLVKDDGLTRCASEKRLGCWPYGTFNQLDQINFWIKWQLRIIGRHCWISKASPKRNTSWRSRRICSQCKHKVILDYTLFEFVIFNSEIMFQLLRSVSLSPTKDSNQWSPDSFQVEGCVSQRLLLRRSCVFNISLFSIRENLCSFQYWSV